MNWREGQEVQSGKYRIIRQIGGGGFGLTYLATHQFLQRSVVLKTPNQIFQEEQDYQKFIRRFQQEGRALSTISHPNVVQFIDFFKEGEIPCLGMAYVDGETLNEYIRRKGYMPQSEAVQCFRKLAKALHKAHQANVIHCDVHPSNIILCPDGEPVLIDFGSAKFLYPTTYSVTTTFNECFSPYEQRPDQGEAQVLWDIYALAATLYFGVTGQKPIRATDRKYYGDKLQAPKSYRKDLSDRLEQAILTGMALDAVDRPQSMQHWLDLLDPPSLPKHTSPPKSTSAKPSSSAAPTLSTFPWLALVCLILGYLPTGLVIGLSKAWAWVGAGTGAWAGAWALAGACAGAWVGVGAGAWAGALAVVLAEAWALAWALAWVWAKAGAWAWAVAGAWSAVAWVWALAWVLAGAGALALAGVGTLARNLALAGALLGGAVAGHWTGIGILSGVGIGLIAFIQWFLILAGLGYASEALSKS